MISKDELLAQLQADRLLLLQAIDDVPNEALEIPATIDGKWSALDILAFITAWDGETIRRIAVAGGESRKPVPDVTDTDYWQSWSKEQVEIKRIMGARGIKVDMAGTWVRLLALIEGLSPADYARWLEIDPQATTRRDADFIPQLQAWRRRWEQSLPWWLKLQRRVRIIWRTKRP